MIDNAKLEIRLSANFSLGLLSATLEMLIQKAGMCGSLRALEQNQALPHASRLATHGSPDGQIDIILLDLQSWLSTGDTPPLELEDNVTVFVNTLEIALAASCEVLVGLAPITDGLSAEDASRLRLARAQITKLAEANNSLTLVDLAVAVEQYNVSYVRTIHRELSGSLPFTDEFQVSAAALIARHLFAQHGHHYKVVVVDCDNTLWTGECTAPSGVTLSEANLLLQRTLKTLVARGFLLCLLSKNEQHDVLACLRNTDGMLIHEDDVTDTEIGWSSKSEGIALLAERLDLSLDAFIFVDDDSFECADVSYHHPSVIVLPFTTDVRELKRYLTHLWAFDERPGMRTAEDTARASWYRAEAKRKVEAKVGDLDQFLCTINLSVEFTLATVEDLPRLAQLTHRAHQWNNLEYGRSPESLGRYTATDGLYTLRVRDRYSDYGIVGIVGYREAEGTLVVDIMALSCRALGKNVEYSMFQLLAQLTEHRGRQTIRVPLLCTYRNTLMRHSLETCGFSLIDLAGRQALYSVDFRQLYSVLEPRPYGHRLRSELAREPMEIPTILTDEDDQTPPAREHDLAEIATFLSRASLLLSAVLARRSHDPQHLRPIVAPRTPTEAEVLRIWQSVLPLREISVEDDFFDLQADSLLAIHILARLKQRLGAELPIDFLFERTFSIATIAEAVDISTVASSDPALLAEEFAIVAAMSDEEVLQQVNKETNK
jgi:FkbH-like protein